MKTKPKYRVHVWDNDVDNTETVFEAPAKPTLEQLYKLIGCTMVERVSGYDKSVSNRTFDIWIDEEGKFNSPVKNLRATNSWFNSQPSLRRPTFYPRGRMHRTIEPRAH